MEDSDMEERDLEVWKRDNRDRRRIKTGKWRMDA